MTTPRVLLLRTPALYLLYFFSGVISICYEVLWSRYLALQFGISIFGVVTTVAAFMFGLGAGSLLGTRYAPRIKRPLLAFAAVELLVAVFALFMPLLFQQLSGLMSVLAPLLSPAQWFGLQAMVALVILFLPACAMGYGFPNILRAAQQHDHVIGRLYGFNAIGGVVGALLPLALLPLFGWLTSNQVIAVAGILVAAAALLLDRRIANPEAVATANFPLTSIAGSLFAYAAVGASALAMQIAWTRLFGMILLRTEYVLAIILAAFLSGIGAGSLVARWLDKELWFGILPLVLAPAALATLWVFPHFSAWIEVTPFSGMASALLIQGISLFALTFPVTLVLGAWLPLLTRRLGGGNHTGAILYGVNSMGAGLGVLLTGWLLVPWLGSAAVVVLSALSLFALGMVWCNDRRFYFAGLLLVPLSYPLWQLPTASDLLPVALAGGADLYVQEDAVAITHVVAGDDGQRLLLSDLQRMDASTAPEAVTLQKNQLRLPLLLHPHAQSVLLLGLGTGISASVLQVLPDVDGTAVELSAGAIAAAEQWFHPVNGNVMPRLRVVRDDARHYLMASQERYDLILGDLFHPDLVGRGALLSAQQFSRARNLLNSGGMFVQWLSLNQFDVRSLQTVLATFRQSFPVHYLFMDGFRIAMVGARDTPLPLADITAGFARLPQAVQTELSGEEGLWTWLGRFVGTIPELSVPIQDEWAPVIEYQLPRARYEGGLDLVALSDWLQELRLSPEAAALFLDIPELNRTDFLQANRATVQAHQAWRAILRGQNRNGQVMMQQALQMNTRDRWIAGTLAQALWDHLQQVTQSGAGIQQVFGRSQEEVLAAILKLTPEHAGALKASWQLARLAGRETEARQLLLRLRKIAPLDKDLAVKPSENLRNN